MHWFKFGLCMATSLWVMGSESSRGDDWRQFRGTHQTSVAAEARLPTTWNVKEGTNVAWSSELPGRGPSSPMVVKDRVIVTASSGAKQDRLHVLCFSAADGSQLWHRQFWATGRCFSHPQSANAAPTPASDGERIFAFYSSNDLVCLDLDGNLLWYRGLAVDYPKAGNDAGMSSSPLVIGDTVVVQVESQGDSFATGLNTSTGEPRWVQKRSQDANWSSPAELRGGEKSLLLLQSPRELVAVEPHSGEVIWKHTDECQGIPSCATAEGRIFLPARGMTVLSASPASPTAKVEWQENKLSPGSASPIVHGDELYIVNRAGVLNCANAETGKSLWEARLKGAFWATPVIAGEHMYCVNFDGACLVVHLDRNGGKVVATNEFGEKIQASPAISNNALFVRSDQHLWKISESK